MRWSEGPHIEEARRNVVARPATIIVLVLLCGGVVGIAARQEARAMQSSIDLEREQVGAGKHVFVATLSNDKPMSAAACLRLNGSAGVVAASPVSSLGIVHFDSAPNDPVVLQNASAELLRIIDPAAHVGQTAVSSVVAKTVSVREGGRYSTSRGDLVVDSVYDPERRAPTMVSTITIVATMVDADACWIEFLPLASSAARDMLIAALATPYADVVVSDVLARDQFFRDPVDEFSSRSTRHAWAVVGGVVAAVVLASAWAQRGQWALYRLLGAARTDVLALAAIDTLAIVSLALPVSLTTLVVNGDFGERALHVGCETIVLAAGLGAIGGFVGACTASCGRVGARLRE